MESVLTYNIVNKDSEAFLQDLEGQGRFDLSFLDPPFNQGKKLYVVNDSLPDQEYWDWMTRICKLVFNNTKDGGAVYFMQREKNTEFVLRALRESGWKFRNLIIWKKKASASPSKNKLGLHYQIIAYAIKGDTPRVFNKLRIDPPLLVTEKYSRPSGMFVTDVWDDIRELTSGFYAGSEPLRNPDGTRILNVQSPLQLLVRIILSSTNVGDLVFDPFCGTGTTLVAANQLGRYSIGVEIYDELCNIIRSRLAVGRESDNISKYRQLYKFTPELDSIWPEVV
jgi:DNA modification methylase